MRFTLMVALTGALLAPNLFSQDKGAKLPGEDWIQLFNGKDRKIRRGVEF